jgi:glycosyltransferase involved in cell wall biosynthesis
VHSVITIITPVLNAEKTIAQCLQSVAEQTYPHKEHWIIDGVSTDKTLEIIREWAEKYPHIHHISEKDTGIYQAMNRGIEKSRGAWVYFLGGDDVLASKTVLEEISPFFKESKDMLLGNVLVKGLKEPIVRHPNLSWERFLYCSIIHQSCFYRKTLFTPSGYDETKQIAADYKFNLQLIENKTPYQLIDKTVCIYYAHGRSGSETSTTLKEMNQCRREILPPLKALFFNTIVSMGFYGMQFLKKIVPPPLINTIQVLKQRYLMR